LKLNFFKNLLIFVFFFIIIFLLFLVLNFFIFKKDNPTLVRMERDSLKINEDTVSPIPSIIDKNNYPSINARAAILVDLETGYVMFRKNENLKVAIASTTKIATAITVLEDYYGNLEDIVNVSSRAAIINGSDIKLEEGEKIKVKKLLYGLLINSGNDAAYALADHFGGKEKFVSEMNAKVEKIGLKNTHYLCPAGLDDDGFSTAYDLTILARYAMRDKIFREIVRIPEMNITSEDGNIVHELKNSNRLMLPEENNYYPQAIGIKTGFTYEAGHALVSAAEQDKHTLISVVLNTFEDNHVASAGESKKLLEWGFANWRWNR